MYIVQTYKSYFNVLTIVPHMAEYLHCLSLTHKVHIPIRAKVKVLKLLTSFSQVYGLCSYLNLTLKSAPGWSCGFWVRHAGGASLHQLYLPTVLGAITESRLNFIEVAVGVICSSPFPRINAAYLKCSSREENGADPPHVSANEIPRVVTSVVTVST